MQRTDLEYERERAEYLLSHARKRYESAVTRLDQVRASRKAELMRFLDAIARANEPTVLPEGSFETLQEINRRHFVDFDGTERSLLDDHELQFLMIRKGNLDDRERREIESHVTHTYRFLEQIPWTRELKGIPTISYGHHKKPTARGNPNPIW